MDGSTHQIYMHRCLQLAKLGSGSVAPNPMVGAVLVHNETIIGEGYHQQYGRAHAEVNCIQQAIENGNQGLLQEATLYVSLEPCAHYGKTPPCADLIIAHHISKVVIGCRDPFVQVDGKGIEKLENAGIKVVLGILEDECKELNKRFFTFHTKRRPYIVLKWAETADHKIASGDRSRLFISNAYTNRIVHKWRSEEMAIVAGTNTAFYDDPELSTRLWPGSHPIRIVVDRELRLPSTLKVFDATIPTIVFNTKKHSIEDLKAPFQGGVHYYQVTEDAGLVHQMLHALYNMNIQSALIEGGAALLQSFIDEGMWDEAKVITNEKLIIGEGLPAPVLNQHQLMHTDKFLSDIVHTYHLINPTTV
jgi:diaminohydroxyphosphoribosylaminopyrimidine deaminase/5-amino-6-(5-phosphoribosylamino)uracil reductase